LEFLFDDILVEWLHDVFVRTGLEGASNMRDIIFSRAKRTFCPSPPGSRRNTRKKS